jgi:TolA-binding protein
MAWLRSTTATTKSRLADHRLRAAINVRQLFGSAFATLLFIVALAAGSPAIGGELTDDRALFVTGFDSYQKKDYVGSTAKLNELLDKYPDSPLRDLTLFWLSRSYYRTGNQQEMARYLAKFVKEYPDSPMRKLVEDDMFRLLAKYERGEKLPTRAIADSKPAGQPAG